MKQPVPGLLQTSSIIESYISRSIFFHVLCCGDIFSSLSHVLDTSAVSTETVTMGGDRPTCFKSDGTVETNTQFQPCNQIPGQPSMCCATNRTIPAGAVGSTADLCLPNGLCKSISSKNGQDLTIYWREGCSANKWGTSECLNACTQTVCSNF